MRKSKKPVFYVIHSRWFFQKQGMSILVSTLFYLTLKKYGISELGAIIGCSVLTMVSQWIISKGIGWQANWMTKDS
ncbi:hypothetical protein [Mangrovibacillus cuniculi]|uniref:Uncharacterized protein n=1 Tax=Mangrovibacillus cuniculi TaxID=2593652 RepID=A0A7S8HEQ7_9BACI|nr:hypothetical protein [Mangrovibacillus cuniculi]QPC45726.1 hypothetical protein G8O30_01440 [Mangrovibacillus cuniculi]